MDKYEEELEEFLNKGVYTPSKNQKRLMKEAKEAARNYLARKSITLRVKNKDLGNVKAKAKKIGLPYQTVLNLLIGQYANGKIKLAI